MFWAVLALVYSASETALVEVREPTVVWKSILKSNEVFVSTSDGFLHDIDLTSGRIRWSLDTGGAFFNSSVKYPQNRVSLDGFIFTKSGNGMKRWPVPVRNLSETNKVVIKEFGQIKSSVKSSSFVVSPTSEIPGFLETPTQIERLDYEINITKSNEIIHYSELSVIVSEQNELNRVQIIARQSSGVQIVVNDTIKKSVALPGYPVSVMGTDGFFEFMTYIDGQRMSSSSVAVIKTETNSEVTIPPVSNALALSHRVPRYGFISARVERFDHVHVCNSALLAHEQDFEESYREEHKKHSNHVYSGIAVLLLGALVLVGFEVCNTVVEQVRVNSDAKKTLQNLVRAVVGKNINRVVLRRDVIAISKSKLLQRKDPVFHQIQQLRIFDSLRSDTFFDDFFARLTEENANELASQHPLFWDSRAKERWISSFFYAPARTSSAVSIAPQGILSGAWTHAFREFDDSHRSMIDTDASMRRIPRGDEETVDHLLKYIRNKVAHANETKLHIEKSRGTFISPETICTSIFEYMAEPFPGLLLAIFRSVN